VNGLAAMRRTGTLVLCFLLVALCARAETAGDKVAAEALLTDGRRLMQVGQYARACEKLEASVRMASSVDAILELSDCYEKVGRLASAWASYCAAASAARAAKDTAQEETAREKAAKLEQKLTKITLAAPPGKGVTIVMNGKAVDPAAFGTPLPVDPGSHTIVVSGAAGDDPKAAAGDGAGIQIRVDVPSPVAATASSGGPTDPGQAALYGRQQRTVGVVVGALGVFGLGAGTYFGLRARSLFDDAKSHCVRYPDQCGLEAVTKSQEAKQAADISTVSFVIGLAGVGGGIALWLTAPRPVPSVRAAFGVGPGTVTLQGEF
jgi:hypothetical protein